MIFTHPLEHLGRQQPDYREEEHSTSLCSKKSRSAITMVLQTTTKYRLKLLQPTSTTSEIYTADKWWSIIDRNQSTPDFQHYPLFLLYFPLPSHYLSFIKSQKVWECSNKVSRHNPAEKLVEYMDYKQMCGSADMAMGKRWIKTVDAKCRCVGKRRMCR